MVKAPTRLPSGTVVVCVMPPPVPVTVIVYVPVAVVEATVMVMVEVPEPGAVMDAGLKLTVTPVGWPVAVKSIAELKPPETVGSDGRWSRCCPAPRKPKWAKQKW